MTDLWFEHALLEDGWATDVRVVIEGTKIAAIHTGVAAGLDDRQYAVGVPGMPNLHSHAFQRAMAGLSEVAGIGGNDNFWTWRTQMYRLVDRLTPDHVRAIAAMAQIEMLEAGFTRTGEFHYLHNDPSGNAYASPAIMAQALADAAAGTGIGLSLLPVFYAHSDFDGVAPTYAQRRFVTSLDSFVRLFDASCSAVASLGDAIVGIAPHSLRAATPYELGALASLAPSKPMHIHIAEQTKEVDACVAWSGYRPVAWLLDNLPVDSRWCLVHATHVDGHELEAMAAVGAIVGLCPMTEANLGDGVFPARQWRALGGAWGIGSDSNVLIDVSEELRLLEYGQRLIHRSRNVLAPLGGSTGAALFREACAGGGRALGVEAGAMRAGVSADIVALRKDETGVTADTLLDRWIFARGRSAVEAVWRAGRQCVSDGRHVARDQVVRSYTNVLAEILA